jgi:phosphate uptake regulator
MLRELLSIFRSGEPLSDMGDAFGTMLKLTYEATLEAGKVYFQMEAEPEARTRIYQQDVKINKLERSIRKQVIAHLSLGRNTASLPYCLLLMSVVKDVERIGDYAKNLAEVPDYYPGPLPDDELVGELKEIRKVVESLFAAADGVFTTSDRERAVELIRQGRDTAHRCDALIERVAHSSYDAGAATVTVLGARYYKRIAAHVLNVLSSVVMPLHKLDYYDEDELQAEGDEA